MVSTDVVIFASSRIARRISAFGSSVNESARAFLRFLAESGSVSARSFPIGQGTMDGTSRRSNTDSNFRLGTGVVPARAEALGRTRGSAFHSLAGVSARRRGERTARRVQSPEATEVATGTLMEPAKIRTPHYDRTSPKRVRAANQYSPTKKPTNPNG